MKLVKGSKQAKDYMASIRAKKKINGNEKKQFYIEFLNKDKGFKKDIKYFNTFQLAKNFALKTFDKFDIDMIKQNDIKKIGSIKASKELKKTLKAKKLYMPHGYETKKRKRKIGEVHTDTKSHNVKINVLSGITQNEFLKVSKQLANYSIEISLLKKQIFETKLKNQKDILKKSLRDIQKSYIALKKYSLTLL